MKAWFGCTTLEWQTYRDYYFEIRDQLVKQGVVILYDWINYADEVSAGKRHNRRAKRVYEQVTEAIVQADFVVIENTVPNFSTAHQISFALLRNKPTLVLRLHKDRTLFNDSYIDSLNNSNLVIKEYTPSTLPDIISGFVKTKQLGNSQGRYNIVLDRKHKYYLDWANQQKGNSRSRVIRDLIENAMNNDDEFAKYLNSIDSI